MVVNCTHLITSCTTVFNSSEMIIIYRTSCCITNIICMCVALFIHIIINLINYSNVCVLFTFGINSNYIILLLLCNVELNSIIYYIL